MTTPTTRTLPSSVRTRALQAIAELHAWNDAVIQARAMEQLAGCSGRYEYDLIASDDPTCDALWRGHLRGGHTLDVLEGTMRDMGWSLEDFYRAVGQDRPALLTEGADVHLWRQAQR